MHRFSSYTVAHSLVLSCDRLISHATLFRQASQVSSLLLFSLALLDILYLHFFIVIQIAVLAVHRAALSSS